MMVCGATGSPRAWSPRQALPSCRHPGGLTRTPAVACGELPAGQPLCRALSQHALPVSDPVSDPAPGRLPPSSSSGDLVCLRLTRCCSDSQEQNPKWCLGRHCVPSSTPAPGAERACPGQACGQREPRPLSLLPLPARPDPPPPRVSPGSGRSQQALDREVPSQPPRLPRGIVASLRPGFPRGHLRHTRLSGLGVLGWTPCPDRLAPCRDGLPYCEADYHAEFGVRCDGCEKFITGHVLEVSGRCGPRRLSPTLS